MVEPEEEMVGDLASPREVSIQGQENASSPLTSVSDGGNLKKPRKRPTITPRSFRRFFTPRTSLGKGEKISASRQALRDITAPAINRNGSVSDGLGGKLGLFQDINIQTTEDGELDGTREQRKRRKLLPSPEASPDRPCKATKAHLMLPSIFEDQDTEDEVFNTGQETPAASQEEVRSIESEQGSTPLPIRRLRHTGGVGRVLQRNLGDCAGIRRRLDHCSDWRNETINFYSRPEDIHVCTNPAALEQTLPFSIASCNTNSLIAIGDEEGGIRLLESQKGGKPAFADPYLTLRPHSNAILDLAFSSDDLLLATASGDQTGRIVDMPTQRTISLMAGHGSSVKQIRFQPGNGENSVIATSSRDGSVQIWDLRCRGQNRPVRDFHVSLDSGPEDTSVRDGRSIRRMAWAHSVNTIYDAHLNRYPSLIGRNGTPTDAPSKLESPSRRGDVSITALTFLPSGREHLLLTASEADACVKLWDLRITHNQRRGRAVPLSTTQQPESHEMHRSFGLNSLALSGDGGRLYTLCRDSTVYVYSTAHLILGHAPELSLTKSRSRRSRGNGKEGLGPIYGFRHPHFHAATFYVKASVRPAVGDKTELLAVGSSDGSAVLFPTDERYMQAQRHPRDESFENPNDNTPLATPSRTRPHLNGNSSNINCPPPYTTSSIPVYTHGMPLIRGHQKEVTGTTWTSEGDLITISDDLTARCWREDTPEARDLRMGGEAEGRRWACGWADVEGCRDDDEDC
ncbi:MAG: hypothetical protein M1827_001538 [Pycnora praestabilis]|nr:MAG: hypothetical protein M1827_001538 [Pycnora praestabilis]